jgi:hypothetical protein
VTRPSVVPETADVERLFPPLDETVAGGPGEALSVPRKTGRRRWLWVTVSVALVLAVGGAGAAGWILLHRTPDFHSYDAAVQSTSSIAVEVQASTDNLMSVSDLDAFGRMLTIRDGDLSVIAVQAQSLRNARQRELLLAAVSAERAYLAELDRLVSLPAKTETAGQLQDVTSLCHSLEEALAAAIALHHSATPSASVSTDPTALTRPSYREAHCLRRGE